MAAANFEYHCYMYAKRSNSVGQLSLATAEPGPTVGTQLNSQLARAKLGQRCDWSRIIRHRLDATPCCYSEYWDCVLRCAVRLGCFCEIILKYGFRIVELERRGWGSSYASHYIVRAPRRFINRPDYVFDLSDSEFNLRISKDLFFDILEMIQEDISPVTERWEYIKRCINIINIEVVKLN